MARKASVVLDFADNSPPLKRRAKHLNSSASTIVDMKTSTQKGAEVSRTMNLKLKNIEQTLRKAKDSGYECLIIINGEYHGVEE